MLANGDISHLWLLRFILLIFVTIQAMLVYELAGFVQWKNKVFCRPFRIFTVVIYITIMCVYRDFDIRPEVFPNTILLLATYLAFKIYDDQSKSLDWSLITITILGLIVSSSISLRHVLVNSVFLALILPLSFDKQRGGGGGPLRRTLLILILASCSVLILLYAAIPYISSGVTSAISFQAGREGRSWIEKLTVGGSISQLYLKGSLLIACVLLIMANAKNTGKQFYHSLGLSAWILSALLAFYLFLFTLDVRPFEYVRSIE